MYGQNLILNVHLCGPLSSFIILCSGLVEVPESVAGTTTEVQVTEAWQYSNEVKAIIGKHDL